MGSQRAAKRALIEALQKSSLSVRERAVMRFAIAFKTDEVIELVEGMAKDAGKANAQGQIDWEEIKDFLVTIIPLIVEALLKLLPIFAGLV